jgi:uncharacterized RDD family membrane protein YckC
MRPTLHRRFFAYLLDLGFFFLTFIVTLFSYNYYLVGSGKGKSLAASVYKPYYSEELMIDKLIELLVTHSLIIAVILFFILYVSIIRKFSSTLGMKLLKLKFVAEKKGKINSFLISFLFILMNVISLGPLINIIPIFINKNDKKEKTLLNRFAKVYVNQIK